MPIIAKANGTNFTPAPEGTHSGVCVDVIDLGMLEVSYNNKTKSQHKIKIVWQIDEDRQDDGKPFQVSKRYTLSLHEKAGLRKDLESWRGRAFTDAELDGFDVENVLDVPCMLNIIHAPGREGGVFANVAGVMKLPKGMQPLKSREYVRMQDREPQQSGGATQGNEWNNQEITDDDIPF